MTLKSTGVEACKITTDADGYAITPLLPYGVYRIEETKGAECYKIGTRGFTDYKLYADDMVKA